MNSSSDNIEIMINDKANAAEKMFAFNCVHLLYYKFHKMNPNRGGSYHIDSPDWIKIEKTAINSINKNDNKCFQYTVIVALNHEQNYGHLERITQINPFINKYNWNETIHPSKKMTGKNSKK